MAPGADPRRTTPAWSAAVPRTLRRALLPVLALLLALPGCGGEDDEAAAPVGGPPAGASADTTDPAAPSAAPSAGPGTSSSAAPTASGQALAGTDAVAVYWVMDSTGGPRLYREFADRPAGGEPVRDALELMLAGEPDDPDYTSLWPEGTRVLGVDVTGSTATVDLSGQALEGSAGSAFEQATVQQLVHTVTAADPALAAVRLRVDGAARETLWGAVRIDGDLTRAPQAEVLGPVWVLTPVQGGTVAEGGTVSGVATVFEATVSWQWMQDGEVVAEGFSTASEGGPGRGDWTAPVDVPPGEYELRAFASSAEDGRETFVDTKSVTVTG